MVASDYRNGYPVLTKCKKGKWLYIYIYICVKFGKMKETKMKDKESTKAVCPFVFSPKNLDIVVNQILSHRFSYCKFYGLAICMHLSI